MRAIMSVVAICLSATAIQEPRQQATSLLGKPLVPATVSANEQKKLEAELADARAAYDRTPNDAEAIIWLGRRMAYLGRYLDAIQVFTEGIEKHPSDPRLYRHRGHRYITVRQLDRAAVDLGKAAHLVSKRPDEVEPDGRPNARNIPTSTLKTNIYYHLGLAFYLKGDFKSAEKAYRECLFYSKNPDMLSATAHWLYMTLKRLERGQDAELVLERISPEMDIIENASYHKLLMLYKGRQNAEELLASSAKGGLDAVTIQYGVGNWHLYNGRRDAATAIFKKIVDEQPSQWPAFGYVAAEAELAR